LKFKEPDIFYNYCAGDAVSHLVANLNMRDKMKAELPPYVSKYYFEIYLPLTNYMLDMEFEGLNINQPFMEELTYKYATRYEQLKEKLLGLLRPLRITEFNPNSSPDKTSLLYSTLKMDPPYYTKAGKSPKPRSWYKLQKPGTQRAYKPSANGKSISSIRFDLESELKKDPNNIKAKEAHEIVKTLLMLGRTGVFANKFFSKKGTDFVDDISEDEAREGDEPLKSSYWAALHKDGKIHADFYECLNNFRASSRVNVQNPASKVLSHMPECFEGSNIECPENIRRIFYPGQKDWYYVEVDVQGADLMVAALLSKDPLYLADMRAGGFHSKKMKEYFQNDKLTKDDASSYVTAKSITFRVAYTSELPSAALPIQAEIYAESGLWIELELIKYALGTWERYEQYIKYRERCKEMVMEHGYVQNERGFKYLFDKTRERSVLPGWLNEALAYPIASELALFMWDVAVSMKEQLRKDGNWMKWIKPVNSIHDAHHWIIHKDALKDNYFPETCLEFFCRKTKVATGDTMGIEMTVNDCWKGAQKIFGNETVWVPESKSWEWKSKKK